ncbi:tetratricopeptide repeat protein [Nocardia takedensis]|uniref:tetratricopeptide repeat protein n=1 Tax=Nocardia takedensis TaxID=259390 RepID=UPI003F75988A
MSEGSPEDRPHPDGRLGEAAGDRARTLSARAELAVEAGELKTAHEHFDTARELFADDERHAVIHCWYMMGRISHELRDPITAERELRTALRLAETLGDHGSAAECEDALANVLAVTGRLDQAARMLETAVGHYPSHRALKRADCLNRAAVILGHLAKHDAALSTWGRAQEEYLAGERDDLALGIALDRGRVLAALLRLDEALEQYRAAHALSRRAGWTEEAAWCETQLATVHLACGDIATAERLLTGAIGALADSDRERYLRSRYFLARVYVERGDAGDARELLSETQAEARAREVADLVADCLILQAQVLIGDGDHRAALTLLDEPRRILAERGMWPNVAACQNLRGTCLIALTEFSAAEETLLDARATLGRHGFTRVLADTDTSLGIVYSRTGRYADAETAFARALTGLRASGNPLVPTAKVEFDLAGVRVRLGNHAGAAELFEKAEAAFSAAGATGFAAACRQGRGLLEVMSGDIESRFDTLDAALDRLGTGPVEGVTEAQMTRTIALAHAARDETDVGLTYIARARRLFAESNDLVEVALCDVQAAAFLYVQTPRDLRRIVDLALPAKLFIDHLRLQFVHASTRAAWTAQYGVVHRELFVWAREVDDPVLMADLIEVAANSGTHVAQTEQTAAGADFLAALAADPAAGAATDLYAAADLPAFTAATILIAAATLPMLPPPRLRLPDGRVALAEFLDASVSRYGSAGRTAEIRAW